MAQSDYKHWKWSAATPGYIIFLVDQSSLMNMPFNKNETKAEATARFINRTINELINTNMDGVAPKDRVFISIIGYGGKGGNSVDNVRSDYLSSFANHPIRIEKRKQKIDDGNGEILEVDIDVPIFIDAITKGNAPMGEAFNLAKDLIDGWITKKPDNPLPVIINISAGIPFDESYEEPQKVIRITDEIKNIKVDGFSPIIFNTYLGNTSEIIAFPNYLSSNEYGAKLLFKISSELPNYYKNIPQSIYKCYFMYNAKAFCYNAFIMISTMIYFGKVGIGMTISTPNFGESIIYTTKF